MQSRTYMLFVTALTAGAALLLGTAAWAADPIQVAGKLNCKTTEQHAIPLDGDPDHILLVQKVTCSVSASGQSARFDGGEQTNVETNDLVRGSGTIHGYDLVKNKDGSTETDSYAGQVTTRVVDGKPVWAAQGTWEQIHSTGSLANVQQRGTWKAKPTSETESVGDFEGTLTEIGKP
jgi:hypothetical protein